MTTKTQERKAKLAKMKAIIEYFLKKHGTVLRDISESLPSMFEGLCVVYVAQYYERLHFKVKPMNLFHGSFRLKYGTNGYPQNYSYFAMAKDDISLEIRHNLPVQGANDPDTIYVADVAVIKPDSLIEQISYTRGGRRRRIYFCPNYSLRSFAEVKDLLAYSMLIAQFLGVVFELKPRCLRPSLLARNAKRFANHIFPSLMVSGPSHPGANVVISSLKKRKYAVVVACNLLQSITSFQQEQDSMRAAPGIVAAK